MKYVLYEHILKIDKRKYIGITKQKPEKRWQNGLGYVNSSYFYNAIKKYGWDNFEHKIIFENLTKEEAEQKEKEMIKKYKTNIKGYGFNAGNIQLVCIGKRKTADGYHWKFAKEV